MNIPSGVYIVTLCLFSPSSVASNQVPVAYKNIAKSVGVPSSILYAIALQESRLQIGRAEVPWPWSLNIDGSSKRLGNRDEMWLAIEFAQASGAKFIDVGLMQVNLYFHGHRFDTKDDLLDPYSNIRVGAEILKVEKELCGHWWCAVARYHSRTPSLGSKYRKGVRQLYERLER